MKQVLRIYFVDGTDISITFSSEELLNQTIEGVYKNSFQISQHLPESSLVINWKQVKYAQKNR